MPLVCLPMDRLPGGSGRGDLTERQGWNGRPVRIEQAQGLLVAALGVLAGWYGYGQR